MDLTLRHLRPTALLLFALLALQGCVFCAEELPPELFNHDAVLIQQATPGQGGVFLWDCRVEDTGDVSDAVLGSLRASGLFSEVRRAEDTFGYREFDPAVHGNADWILTVEEPFVEAGVLHPEVPLITLLTFGFIPTTRYTEITKVYRLTRVGGPSNDSRTIALPYSRAEVIGSILMLGMSMYTDWHVLDLEQKRHDRLASRLVTEVLRTVVHAPHQ